VREPAEAAYDRASVQRRIWSSHPDRSLLRRQAQGRPCAPS
jgi:hypothetical protein